MSNASSANNQIDSRMRVRKSVLIEYLVQFISMTISLLAVFELQSAMFKFWGARINEIPLIFLVAAVATLLVAIARRIVSYLIRKENPDKDVLAIYSGIPEKNIDAQEVTRLRGRLEQVAPDAAEKLTVMVEIDGRVRQLQQRANAILMVIGGSLVAAALIVIFAGRLTSIDASAVSNIDKLNGEMKTLQTRLNSSSVVRDMLAERDEAKAKAASSEAERIARRIEIMSLQEAIPRDGAALAASMAFDQKRLVKLGDLLLEEGWKRELIVERGYGDWKYIIATAITRIGVVIIIVYLVQILMGLYRYNSRLIAHYSARRDILTVWDGKPGSLKTLDTILAAPRIDFGREPRHPLEDILKTVGAKLREATSQKSTSGPSDGKA